MSIPFTQYLRPNGEQNPVTIERPTAIEERAREIIAAGFRFECEELRTGECSFTIYDPTLEEDIAIEVCENGPPVLVAIDKLIMEFVLPT